MRVTFNSLQNNSLIDLNKEASKQARLQAQIASGQKISQPSDDPFVAQKILALQSSNAQDQQFYRNAGYALDISRASFNAMDRVRETVDRAGEIVEGISGLTTPDALQSYAAEVDGLIEQSLAAVNTQFDGKALFGGTKTDVVPFAATRDAAGKVTGVSYVGAAKGADLQISDSSTLSPYVNGTSNTATADFINHLITLRDAFASGDGVAVTALVPDLRDSENDVLSTVGGLVAQQNRLEKTQDTLTTRFDEATMRISGYNDLDLSQAIVDLTKTQTAYQAALQATAKIASHSLLDYL